ncbi:hypothetical protein H0H92_010532 [Tricholoma furcatifolium]|nr:hypothetical protein H0H92_010532 [Tricholoma furcatifolium]
MSVDSGSRTLRTTSLCGEKEMLDDDIPQTAETLPTQEEFIMDEGRDAWLTIAGTYLSAFGVYQDYYTRQFLKDRSPSDIRRVNYLMHWIGSFQLFMQYAPGFLVGRAFDAGYLAMATGIAVSGASVGGVIWPIMLNQLQQRTTFANSIRATAALTGALLLAANVAFKPRSVPKRPSDGGLQLFQVIVHDSPYLSSIAAAFCIGVGLFFPCKLLRLAHAPSPDSYTPIKISTYNSML